MSTDTAAKPDTSGRTGLVLRWIARGILFAIAAFWIWFGIADGLHDAQSFGLMGFLMMLPAALITLAVVYVAWRWEFIGGLVLLAISLLGGWLFYQNVRQWPPARDAAAYAQGFAMLAAFVLAFLVPAVLLLIKSRLDWMARRAGPNRV